MGNKSSIENLSQTDKVDLLISKFAHEKVTDLTTLKAKPTPQILTGIVAPYEKTLRTKMNGGKECVLWASATVEETDTVTTVRMKYSSSRWHHQGFKVLHEEGEYVDFLLVDPRGPHKKIIVPIADGKFVMTFELDGMEDRVQEAKMLPHTVLETIAGVDHIDTGKLKISEASFDVGEQITLIAIVEEVEVNGEKVFRLKGPQTSDLTEAYFAQHHWSAEEVKLWQECAHGSVIITDTEKSNPGLV